MTSTGANLNVDEQDATVPTVVDGTSAVPFNEEEETAHRAEFGDDGHKLGMKYRQLAFIGVVTSFEIGHIESDRCKQLQEQGRALKGRNSELSKELKKWRRAYAPWLEDKTADRWRKFYKLFAPLVEPANVDSVSTFKWENLRLTAVYELIKDAVPKYTRKKALELTNHTVVDKKLALGLVPDGNPQTSSPRRSRKSPLSRGTRTQSN